MASSKTSFPGLAESSDEDFEIDVEFRNKYFGKFPWGRKPCKHVQQQIDLWFQLDDDYRTGVADFTLINLMSLCFGESPTHFLSQKAQVWTKELLVLKEPLPVGVSTHHRLEEQLIIWRMISSAHEKLNEQNREDLAVILEFGIEAFNNHDTVPKSLTDHGKLLEICNHIKKAVESHPTREVLIAVEEKRKKKFIDCKFQVALIVIIQFADVLINITHENRDVVREMALLRAESGRMMRFKDIGNAYFKNQSYFQALKIYTDAIKDYPLSAVLFSNRSITAMKVKIYDLAVLDGYRATILKPNWGKAYHRRAEALWLSGRLGLAIETNSYACKRCTGQEDRVELLKQQNTLREYAQQDNRDGVISIETKILAPEKISAWEEVPDLVSDDDSVKNFSDSEPRRLKAKRLKREEKKSKKAAQEEKTLKILSKNTFYVRRESSVATGSPARKEKKKNNNAKQQNEQKEKTRKASIPKNEDPQKDVKPKPQPPEVRPSRVVGNSVFIGDVYHQHVSLASRALLEKRHDDAISGYDAALRVVNESNHREWKITEVESFVLTFARGYASLQIGKPRDVSRALDFFVSITGKPNQQSYCHPMAFYERAQCHYLLNNFLNVPPIVDDGLKLMKKKSFPGVLTWPGVSDVIVVSDVKHLKQLLENLFKSSQNPPRPDVVCRYVNCGKEYSRNGIYFNDLDFEGFVNIICDWSCETRYHNKCWSKFKHNHYHKTGDKEILGLRCQTDGCHGIVCSIRMTNDDNNEKRKVSIHAKKTKKERINNFTRQGKSERNLIERKLKIAKAKERKAEFKAAKLSSLKKSVIESKVKIERVRKISDNDIANATVIKKEEYDSEEHNSKSKNKAKAKSKRKDKNGAISLQTFLSNGLRQDQLEEAKKTIGRIANSDTPFRLPEELFLNHQPNIRVVSSELDLEEEQLKLASLYSFIEEFLKRNGPTHFNDPKLHKEITRETMTIIESSFSDFKSFIQSNSTFLFYGSTVYLKQQEDEVLFSSLQNNEKSPGTSNPAGGSSFLKELINVGDVPLSDIVNITGEGAGASRRMDASTFPLSQPPKSKNVLKISTPPPLAPAGPGEKKKLQKLVVRSEKKSKDGVGEKQSNFVESFMKDKNQSALKRPEAGDCVIASPMTSEKVGTCSVATQAEEVPAPGEQIMYMEEEKRLLQERVEELTDKLTRVNVTARTEHATLNKQIGELNEQLAGAKAAAAGAQATCEAEVRKAQKDKASWQETVKSLKKQVKEAQDSSLEAGFKLAEKQNELDGVTAMAQKYREECNNIKSLLSEETKDKTEKIKELTERTILAELTTLETQEKFGIVNLQRAKIDCAKFASQYEALFSQCPPNNPLHGKYLEASRQWKKNADDCQMKLDQTRSLFHEQSLLIRHGKVLSELPFITIPNPPPPPSNLHPNLMKSLVRAPPQHPHPMQHPNRIPMLGEIRPPQSINQNSLGLDPMMAQQRHPSSPVSPYPWSPPTSSSPVLVLDDPSWPRQFASQPNGTNGREAVARPTAQIASPQKQPVNPPQPVANHVKPTPTAAANQAPPSAGHVRRPNSGSPATQQQQQQQTKGSFERIMEQLQKIYPNFSRSELAQCIKEVRQNNNNSLTGISLEDIVKQASVVINKRLILRKQQNPGATVNSLGGARVTSSPSVAPWINNKSGPPRKGPGGGLDNGEEEPCVICHDPLTSNETHRLLCGHVFHRDCLNQWLTRNRTCPTCRDYAIDTSEYPTLKSTVRP